MNRMFKLQIHDKNDKDIIILSCRVVSGQRFKVMTEEDKLHALQSIAHWERSLEGFKQELQIKFKTT